MKPDPKEKFVGIQVSPISFVDEGVDQVLDTLKDRVGVNVLMLGTVSWLGLKTGRSASATSWTVGPITGCTNPIR